MTRVIALQDVDVCWKIDLEAVCEEDQQLDGGGLLEATTADIEGRPTMDRGWGKQKASRTRPLPTIRGQCQHM